MDLRITRGGILGSDCRLHIREVGKAHRTIRRQAFWIGPSLESTPQH